MREDRIAAFVAAAHPLARRKLISLGDLVKWPVVLREQGSVTRMLLLDELARRRTALSQFLEIDTREAAREAVTQNLGIGIVSRGEFVADPRLRLLGFADWNATMSEWLVCLAVRADLHLMRAVIDIAGKAADSIAPLEAARLPVVIAFAAREEPPSRFAVSQAKLHIDPPAGRCGRAMTRPAGWRPAIRDTAR